MHVLNTLAPVFLVIALGAGLRWIRFFSEPMLRDMNRLAYWVGLPCLLFYKIATAHSTGDPGPTVMILLIGMGACIVVSLIAAVAMRMHGAKIGSFVQVGFRGNLAYVGLAVIIYAFGGSDSPDAQAAQTTAILAMAPLVPLYNIAAVVALLASQHRFGRAAIKKMLVGITTNPLLIACVAGGVYSWLGLPMPTPAGRTLDIIGQFTLPMALLAIGGTLAATKVRGHVLHAFVGAVIKIGVAPAVGLLATWWLGLGPQETTVTLILLACPTAVASYVMADQLGGDGPFSAAAIVLSTILSIIPLSIILALS